MEVNKQEQLILKIKELITTLEKDTLKKLEQDIERGYGIFHEKLSTLSNLNKIDVGLQMVQEGVKGLQENEN